MTSIEFDNQLMKLESKLQRFALKLTTNREDALDLCQETFYKAIVYRKRFKHTNMQAWVFTIMRNTFINGYRKKIRSKTRFENQEHVLENFQETTIEGTHPLSAQYCKEITEHIETLDDASRKPFKMHIEGYKYREIAQQLKIPMGTVKNRIFLGRQQLMHKLIGYDSN